MYPIKVIMKKITIIAMLLAMLAIVGCRRSDSNGKIDGFWRVASIETRADGDVREVGNLFIGIQLELFQLRGNGVTGVMNYDKKDGWLVVDFKDPNPAPMNVLRSYGIYENPETFQVDFTRHNEMLLTTDETIIKCHRY